MEKLYFSKWLLKKHAIADFLFCIFLLTVHIVQNMTWHLGINISNIDGKVFVPLQVLFAYTIFLFMKFAVTLEVAWDPL